MRKYLYVFKFELMSSLQYLFNVFSKIINYFLMLFIFMNLWRYIYSDPNELINGYSIEQMIWYVIFTELLWFVIRGRKFCRRIVNDVKGGNIVYNINKPYNYINYLLASHLGEIASTGVIYTCVAVVIGLLFLGRLPSLSVLAVFGIILVSVFATVINTLFVIFIGLFSFVIEDSNPFYWLYSKMILVLGTLFPIEFFPKAMQGVLNYSPVYVVSYGPAKLFVKFSWTGFLRILAAQIVYIFISYLMCVLVYRRGVRRLNVNGG